MTPPTASIDHPNPFISVWLCQGDRRIKNAHTGHRTPKGGPKGQPMMNDAIRNQFW